MAPRRHARERPALDLRGVASMDLDENNEIIGSEVGERHHAVVAHPVDPDNAVFDIHLAGDVEQSYVKFSKSPEFWGVFADRKHRVRIR